MITSLALIFIVGLALAGICHRLRLPRIVGMLLTGILLGPYVLNLFDPSILGISDELRRMALIIILIKAGLSLNLSDLKKVGRPAFLMGFLPATCEIVGFLLFAPLIFGLSPLESIVMGSVMAAASPAIIVPRMTRFIDNHIGTNKSIPQMMIAGVSCDNVYVLVLCSTFVLMAQTGEVDALSFLNIPVSIISGAAVGMCVGFLLSSFFEVEYEHKHYIRNSMKVVIILGFAFLLMAMETWLEGHFSFSGLLAVVVMSCVIKIRSTDFVAQRLSEKYGKIWIAAEVILFVLVGAAIDINYTLSAGVGALLMIAIGIAFRSVGVFLALIKTPLTANERLFCAIAYMPKATVQAAIASVPLAAGLACGQLVFSVAVLAILITAPLGEMLMDVTYRRLLNCQQEKAANEDKMPS